MADEQSSKRTLPIVPIVVAAAIIGLLVFLESGPPSQGNSGDGNPPTVAAGKKIYTLLCSACHHRDPNKGMDALGPPIADSPLELVQMRVLQTKYPKGYTPKRNTSLMPVFPRLKERDLRSIHMFLADAKNNPPK